MVATINHNAFKDVLLDNNFLGHLIDRIKSKDHRKTTYEINKIYLPCFNGKMHILNNGYGGLALGS